MVDFSKFMDRLSLFLDLAGPVIGVLLLVQGVETYRDGGSVAWVVAGAVLLLINLWVAGRRLGRWFRS